MLTKQIASLSLEQQQEVLDFVHFLMAKNQGLTMSFRAAPATTPSSQALQQDMSTEILEKKKLLNSLVGIIPATVDARELKRERLAQQ